ncbi:MAG: alginate lyase family protein [Planctomycetes bacterium]|nr:alginate lyase family protein [Planctomycetota bacterium]
MNRTPAFLATAVLAVAATSTGCETLPARDAAAVLAVPSFTAALGEHPYLYFRASDLPRMREAAATLPEAGTRMEAMLKSTDPERSIGFPPANCPTQGRDSWVTFVHREGGHAARCGALYQLTGDRRYADWARRALLAWAAEFDSRVDFRLCSDFHMPPEPGSGAQEGGNHMGFYHVGILLCNTALAYDCIYDALSADERRTIERDFFRRCVAAIEGVDYTRRDPIHAGDFMYNGGQWNGANLCNMGLTAAGFVLGDARLYRRGVRNFKLYLSRDMLADGFWVEEDLLYAGTCLGSLFNIAWMARSSGYPEDLFTLTVPALDRAAYDARYYNTLPHCDGLAPAARSLEMFLDAHLDYQYPDLSPGNWGWTPGRGSLKTSRDMIAMYNVGYAVYGKPSYAFLLGQVDRTRGSVDGAGIDLLYFGKPLADVAPTPTRSRWYAHGKWVVLKSIEGRDYWNSDALCAFTAYGSERNKGIQPLTLDLFAFGRVLAPRTAMIGYAQNLTKAYQLNEPAWNGCMIDGAITNVFNSGVDRTWMAYYDAGPLVKVAAPRVHSRGERRANLYAPDIERHPEEDRTEGRTLALADRYLVDVYHVSFDRRPAYKRNLDYVLHGYGKLSFEGKKDNLSQGGDVTAVWTRDDGCGLRSTVLGAEPRGGTKFKSYTDPITDFVVATRADFEERFIVVHEPVKDESQIAAIRRIADEDDAAAVEIRFRDGAADLVALRTKATTAPHAWTTDDGRRLELRGNYAFIRTRPDGTTEQQEK